MTRANASFTHAWICGTLRKLVCSLTALAPLAIRRSLTSR
jgi:hypothetical protein